MVNALRRDRSLLQLVDELVGSNGVALRNVDGFDHTRCGRAENILHLHGFDHSYLVLFVDLHNKNKPPARWQDNHPKCDTKNLRYRLAT